MAVAAALEAVIGLEVHAELLTRSKMFCACSAAYLGGAPNAHTCPVCLGLPGALPVMNRQAVEWTIKTALALDCEIPEFTKFDRKNYFYPDLPKGYQISQYDLPLSRNGHLDVRVGDTGRRVGITRVHLEEDTGKLTHAGHIHTSQTSLVDLNRAGVPLMEIVSEPDLRSAAEAREYMQRLRQLLVWIGVSDGRMEEGSLRCDANVSVRPPGQTELGVKVEVKNMNSFRAVFLALEYEIVRQQQAIANGETIAQETRGWNEAGGVTVGQRSKEFAHDYRYFPEPDLPPLTISRDRVDRLRAELPELPAVRAARYSEQLEVGPKEADVLTTTRELAEYFESVVAAGAPAREAANWVLGEVSRVLNSGTAVSELKVRPGALAALVQRKLEGVLNNNQAKELFAALEAGDAIVDNVAAVDAEIASRGLRQVTDSSQLEAWVAAAIAAEAQAVDDFRGGNERALGRLVGAVMKQSQGKANAPAVSEMLRRQLSS
ncbi:MAG: Asp-tRNA(Asn)/Glu-tRNA(Gln) amidotransferase subunit GatB [Candidatus Dormibacteria bacterium]